MDTTLKHIQEVNHLLDGLWKMSAIVVLIANAILIVMAINGP